MGIASPGGGHGDIGVPPAVRGGGISPSLHVPSTSISSISPCRWLLPPQALNAYYLPNKNQMGEALPGGGTGLGGMMWGPLVPGGAEGVVLGPGCPLPAMLSCVHSVPRRHPAADPLRPRVPAVSVGLGGGGEQGWVWGMGQVLE